MAAEKVVRDLSQESSLSSLHSVLIPPCPVLFCPGKHSPNPQTSCTRAGGTPEPFVLGDEMTDSGGLVRLLTSRSQHVSWSRPESSEVTKGAIVLFDPSSVSAIERLPLPLSARMEKKNKKKTFHFIVCHSRVFTTLFKL